MPLNPQVKSLLDGMAQAGGPKMSEISAPEARELYRGLIAFDQPEEVTRVDDRLVPGLDNEVPVRVYTPAGRGRRRRPPPPVAPRWRLGHR